MISRHHYITICIFIFALLMNACKPARDLRQSARASVPGSFEGSNDTVSVDPLSWRAYFSDPRLVNLLDTALKNNWDVRTAFQRIEMAQADVLLNRGALKPTMDAGFTVSQRKFGLYTMDGAGNITTDIEQGKIIPIHLRDYYPGLQASWEADVWGKLRNRKRAAVNRFLASVEGKNFVTTTIIAEVASGYYELLALDNELSILNETIRLQENAFELVRVQKDAGAANELAVKQFEAQLLNSKSMRVEVQQRIIEAENQLNVLLGRYPQPIDRDSSAMATSPKVITTGVPADMLRNRPDIRQAEFELIASQADVKAAKASFYPSLNLNGSIGFQAYATNLLFKTPESYVYGLFGSLTAPLFNRSAIRAEFRSANARQREALYNYERTLVNGYAEVFNHVSGLRNLEEIYALKSGQARALTQSIETSNELFRTGRADYLEVIVTQQNALQARLELIDVRKRQFNTSINLYKALGGGWR
jgi:outer membrane protein, multidrug efflux system